MKTITLEFTTNAAPTNIDATLAHHNIEASVRILRTFPSKRLELEIAEDIDAKHVMKITNANAVMAPRGE